MAVGVGAATFFCYFFSACWLFIFIADDIKEDLVVFNTDVISFENGTDAKQSSDVEHRVKLMNQFCANVQTYTDAKE